MQHEILYWILKQKKDISGKPGEILMNSIGLLGVLNTVNFLALIIVLCLCKMLT